MMLPRGHLEGKTIFQPRAKRFMAIASLGMLAFASGCSAEISGNSSPMGPGGVGPGPAGGSGSGSALPNAGQGGTCDLVAVFKRPACSAASGMDR